MRVAAHRLRLLSRNGEAAASVLATGMPCEPELVTGYVDGELSAEARGRVEAHLSSCAACGEQVQEERALQTRLAELRTVPLPAELERRVWERIRRAPGRRWRRPWPWLAAGLAASVVIAVRWSGGEARHVSAQLALDHGHCAASPPAAVTLALDPRAATACPVLGRTVTHYCLRPDRAASLFVVPGPLDIRGTYDTKTEGRVVRLLARGDRVLGIVAERASDLARVEGAAAALLR